MVKVAIIQEAPVFLDKEKTIQKACALAQKAAEQGAKLVVFPETFIPGYPTWIWRLRPGSDVSICSETHARLVENAVDLQSDDLNPLMEAAESLKMTIVCGFNERDSFTAGGTLYNSLIIISENGEIINHHRKLMPTNPERMTWGLGDARGLKVVKTPVGNVGGLICWENFMPLARYALYSQGVEIYIAPTYDSGDGWIGSMQHIAREGRCWVLCCGSAIQYTDIPADFPDKDILYSKDEEWINPGDSVVVAPGGEIVAGPMRKKKGILYVDVDRDRAVNAKRTLDVAGHYSRPELFSLQVNTSPQEPIQFNS